MRARARPSGAASARARFWLRVVQSQRCRWLSSSSSGAGVAHVAAHRFVGPSHRVGVDAQVQVHELGDVVDDVVRVLQRRAAALRSCARRPPRGGGSSRRRRRTSAVLGLPTSWNSAASRTTQLGPRVVHDRDRVREHVLVACGSGPVRAASRLSSGRNSSARPVSARNQSPALGSSTSSSFDSSSRMRSALTISSRCRRLDHRLDERGVGLELEPAMKRAARSIRSGSSTNETSGASGVRSRRAARSTAPPYGSISSGSGSRSAIALTVKSRRDRSVSMSSENGDLGLAALGPVDLGPERGDLERHAVACGSRRCRTAGPAATRGRPNRSDEPIDGVGPGVGGEVDVGVLGSRAPEQGVAHAAADQVALVARVDEPARELLQRRRLDRATGAGARARWSSAPFSPLAAAPSSQPFRSACLSTSGGSAQVPSVPWGCGARGSAVAETRSPPSASTAVPHSVWLDPLDPERGVGAGVLCARHADTLTPPRGWHLQDRRTPTPRLWVDRPTQGTSVAPPVPKAPAVTAPVANGDAIAAHAAAPAADPLPFDNATPRRSRTARPDHAATSSSGHRAGQRRRSPRCAVADVGAARSRRRARFRST